jgi:hypothetical protein
MAFTRDPLSVRFDPQARLVIDLAIAQAEKWKANRRLVPYVRIRVPNPPGYQPRETDRPDRLTPTERAMSRSLYYDRRIHHISGNRPDARWSLKLEWDPPPPLPGQARYVKVRVFSDTSGARHVEANQATSWVQNPELRSGWQRNTG